jgi:hypothetical protein
MVAGRSGNPAGSELPRRPSQAVRLVLMREPEIFCQTILGRDNQAVEP